IRSLCIDIPDLEPPSRQPQDSRFRLCTPLPRCAHIRLAQPSSPKDLAGSLGQLFRHTTNLIELDFTAFDDFPCVFYGTSLQLHALRTTHTALELLHREENQTIYGQEISTPLHSLQSLHALTLNMRGVEYHAQTLCASFHQYNITHLSLDLAPCRSIAYDVLRLLNDQLVSFKIVLAPLTSELSPFQRWTVRFRSEVHLWPTAVLGDTILPKLKHLEVCESAYTY
ncbi:uncharacterized protein BXZ73DRAFT_21486, partial [Epithele typhae]|uniref:uncharacterized protein n=1 Tax=Epithele typhae TaxID=378194 RepID=UPI002007B395